MLETATVKFSHDALRAVFVVENQRERLPHGLRLVELDGGPVERGDDHANAGVFDRPHRITLGIQFK